MYFYNKHSFWNYSFYSTLFILKQFCSWQQYEKNDKAENTEYLNAYHTNKQCVL